MKIAYINKKFRQRSLELLEWVNSVIDEYTSKGYDLTLRQIYYQLVARDIIENSERSYKNLGSLISDGRMAGIIDWDTVVDRTRMLRQNPHWESPADIIQACANQFAYDKWDGQDNYVEVWVEKDALLGIIQHICTGLDIPYFSCRGYVSQSEMWKAAQRLLDMGIEKNTVIIHLGDHDPSGIDMSRDIQERLDLFGVNPYFRRIALNMNQIEEFGPPPNPTKVTDSRSGGYIEKYGYECWELDALNPDTLKTLITIEANKFCDLELFHKRKMEQEEERIRLGKIADNWGEITRLYG